MGDDVFLDAVVEHGELRILLRREHSPATSAFIRTKDLLEHATGEDIRLACCCAAARCANTQSLRIDEA